MKETQSHNYIIYELLRGQNNGNLLSETERETNNYYMPSWQGADPTMNLDIKEMVEGKIFLEKRLTPTDVTYERKETGLQILFSDLSTSFLQKYMNNRSCN